MKITCIAVLILSSLLLSGCRDITEIGVPVIPSQPNIFPDYAGIAVPANIAPLNFIILENADKYRVQISSKNADDIVISQSSPDIRIPQNKWHALLKANQGEELKISVGIKVLGKWQKYSTITDTITREPIDGYLAYRLINTGYIFWRDMQIAQRNLANFDEKYIFRNSSADFTCVNCHSFCFNDHRKMSLHVRKVHAGTIIADGDSVRKINTKTPYGYSPGVYTSWHPNGKLIAYSANKIGQHFTAFKDKSIIVSDEFSDIFLFNIATNTVIPCPALTTKNRENLPNWSPDGKWLYFICAPPHKKGEDRSRVRYSLCGIAFDAGTMTWGKTDTLISAGKINRSITFPKASPDGKYILFCMTEYGYFTVFDQQSDLYFYEIATGRYWPLACNSTSVESSHSWSANSRWFVFASKRLDNMYTRPYFAYVDPHGRVHKPFIMPQSDPRKYHTYMVNYNLPELVNGIVAIREQELRDIVLQEPASAIFNKPEGIDASSGATWINWKP
jgi:hypothetical protein